MLFPDPSDPWYHARKYAVVIDAGSSGSRSMIYSWQDIPSSKHELASHTLPLIVKGTKADDDWTYRVPHGISSLAGNITGIADYLDPLLSHARENVPSDRHPDTPIFLLATAGMRLLDPKAQADIIHNVCNAFRFNTEFRVNAPIGTIAPCGESAVVITGQDEGRYGWIAANYLKGSFGSPAGNALPTYGFLEMGGASTQIAFAPTEAEVALLSRETVEGLIDVRIRLLDGNEHHYKLFTTTWLHFGLDQARARYYQSQLPVDRTPSAKAPNHPIKILDPCIPRHRSLSHPPTVEVLPSLEGTGRFGECLTLSRSLLNHVPCPTRGDGNDVCLFDGQWVPPIDFSTAKFIGISGYWYSTDPILGQGGVYNYTSYTRATDRFCAREWDSIEEEWHDSRDTSLVLPYDEAPSLPPFKQEVQSYTREKGVWDPSVKLEHLESQCFRSAWVVNVLHKGFGFPEKADLAGRTTTSPLVDIMEKIEGTTVTWTLGKVVSVASLAIPAREPDVQTIGVPSAATCSSVIPSLGLNAHNMGHFDNLHYILSLSYTLAFGLFVLFVTVGYHIRARLLTAQTSTVNVAEKMENGDLHWKGF